MRFDYEEKSFDSEEGTITTHPKYFFDWIPEMSNGSINDSLVLPNIPLMVRKYFIFLHLIKTFDRVFVATKNRPRLVICHHNYNHIP